MMRMLANVFHFNANYRNKIYTVWLSVFWQSYHILGINSDPIHLCVHYKSLWQYQ